MCVYRDGLLSCRPKGNEGKGLGWKGYSVCVCRVLFFPIYGSALWDEGFVLLQCVALALMLLKLFWGS